MKDLLELTKNTFRTIHQEQATKEVADPSSLINSALNTVIGWALSAVTAYATLNFILAMFSYMSNNPQTQMQATDKMRRVCLGVVGAFTAKTLMGIIESQAKSWV